jgi:hypothetical protein
MNNNELIFKFFATHFGADIHVGIEYNSQINILLNDTTFASAVRKMDINKNISPFATPLSRTDSENKILNHIVDCMRHCKAAFPDYSISLLHPHKENIVLFKTK